MPNNFLSRLRPALPLVTRTLVGLALIGGSIGFLQVLRATKPMPSRNTEAGQALLVRTVPVQRVVTARPWKGYGTVRALSSTRVSAQVAGRVLERPSSVEAGRTVGIGDVLVRLDASDYERRSASIGAALASLEAELHQLEVEAASLDEQLTMVLEETEIARREHERAVRAFEVEGAGSRAEVDLRLSALRRAEREASAIDQRSRLVEPRRAVVLASIDARRADLEQAHADIARATITSPIEGVVQSVSLDTGDYARVGDEVAAVVDLRRLELPLLLPASSISDISLGDRVEISQESSARGVWVGVVARVAPQADAATRSIRVFVEVEQDPESDPSTLLRPGQFVVGRVIPSRRTAHLLVPRRAVVQGGVMVADTNSESRARLVVVRTLFALENTLPGVPDTETQWLAVEADLEPGELVLVSNLDDVRDGSPIRVAGPAEGESR